VTLASANDADSRAVTWHGVDWRRVNRNVRRLQARIVKAVEQGKWRMVKNLQRLLTHSVSGRLLAVRRVTENRGKKTPGVDGKIWQTPEQKMNAVKRLRQKWSRAAPLRRIHIPKKNGKKRPLGIPTMFDRAHQALHKLGLEPVAECLADEHSYGFRPERSAQDAAEQVFNALRMKQSAQWVLEGDIKACFDEISHDWLLKHVPMDKRVLKAWLKAGYLEENAFYHTEQGTPQGGVISPILANLCLDGLASCIAKNSSEKQRHKLNVIRYADDFIITGASKEHLETVVKPRVVAFLAERGLRLSEEKTHITRIEKGFDFLGWNVRKYQDKLLIKPAKQSVKTLAEKTGDIIRANRQATTVNLLKQLNPAIRGWANYHKHAVSKAIFSSVDTFIFKQVWQWARRRHPRKSLQWVRRHYFKAEGDRNWVFKAENDQGHPIRLYKASLTPVTRHIKIQGKANPFDPNWERYFEQREAKKWHSTKWGHSKLRTLWRRQDGKCPVCGQGFKGDTSLHVHHVVERCKGGGEHLENLILLHPNCHRQVHHLMKLGADRNLLFVDSTAGA